jgi:bifunctional UDP-N-acetylglucosamine pyrophosphorylase/glucosamine-1-phosphate N-acetyltransferase
MKPLYVLVLAAGQGSRMKSATPKVLHAVAGRPLLEHVLRASSALKPKEIGVVLGVGRDQVQEALEKRGWTKLHIAIQRDPKGSGHAVMMARSWLESKKGTLLVVYGDTPLLSAETLQKLVDAHAASGDAATFLAMDIPNPAGYGRMILAGDGSLERIVEDKDATPAEKKVTLVNSGVACWDIALLAKMLPKIKNNNAKREYYLTDAAGLLREAGHRVGVMTAGDPDETHGINTRVDLAEVEQIFRRQILRKWMLAGVTIVDPATTYVDAEAELAGDCVLWPGTIIQGPSKIATGCEIGPYSIVESADVAEGAKVGPFARLRPGSKIGRNARVGNFVETKKVTLGDGSKVNHLTYLGDAQVGKGVNIGAGTITCNYDGFSKFGTIIEDGVFVGSNTNLVAPVRVGAGAIIGAGSTITKDISIDALAVARSRQIEKSGWAKSFRAKQPKKGQKKDHA